MKPIMTLEKDAKVGIYDCEFVARIYREMIVVIYPYVKWVGNSGTYAERRYTIRDEEIVADVIKSLEDDNEDEAWDCIYRAVDDLIEY